MHAHNMHLMAATDGIDPPGFLAGLRAYVDPRYQLVASTTFENAVRSAVLRLRASGLPVALIVDRGRHAWVLTGFSATADPNRTRRLPDRVERTDRRAALRSPVPRRIRLAADTRLSVTPCAGS